MTLKSTSLITPEVMAKVRDNNLKILAQLSDVVKPVMYKLASNMSTTVNDYSTALDSLSHGHADYRFEIEVNHNEFTDSLLFTNKLISKIMNHPKLVNFRISNLDIQHTQCSILIGDSQISFNLRYRPDNDPDWVVKT